MSKKFRSLIISLAGISLLSIFAGWLFQVYHDTLCFEKLTTLYVINLVIWLSLAKPIKYFSNSNFMDQHRVLGNLICGVGFVGASQVVSYLAVEWVFNICYQCSTGYTLLGFVQSNHLLVHFIAYGTIAFVYQFDTFFQNQEELPKTPIEEDYLMLKQNGSRIKVQFGKIIYLKADNNAVHIYTEQARYIQYGSLKSMEALLIPHHFIRVHRSYLVNPVYIEKFHAKPSGDGNLQMADGSIVKVSRNFKSLLLPQLKMG